jgi:carboxylesterase type B
VTHVPAVHAEQMRSVVDNDELASTASGIRRRLAAVVERVHGKLASRGRTATDEGRRYTRRELRSATTASASRR